MHTGIHVVLGAGQIGSSLAALLRAQGHRVRVVRRSGASSERSLRRPTDDEVHVVAVLSLVHI